MGCPARKVTGKLSGSALMREETLVARYICCCPQGVDIPVTVKMRLGWDDQMLNAPHLAHIAEEEGFAMVAVHGRTRCQFYKGRRIGRPYDVSVRLFPSRFSSMVISTRLPMLIRLRRIRC